MKRITTILTITLFTAFTLAACNQSTPGNEEATSQDKTNSSGDYIVVTANGHATDAGAEIIEAGGSAVDAAVAILSVLTLVEPQSSGLAGGAFMVHYDASERKLSVFDGRERAPASATQDMFLSETGKPMAYLEAKHSGLSVGVPSAVSMLDMAHGEFGILPWGSLFSPAEKLAAEGFEVSPRLHTMIRNFGKYLPSKPEEGPTDAFEYLHVEGQPLPVGYVLKNTAYAEALKGIASNPSTFYSGSIAEEIVAEVAELPRAGGMTLDDLAAYVPQKTEALCMPYRELQICGPQPPSSWLAVGTIMSLVERQSRAEGGDTDRLRDWQHFVNAQRLAYADRDFYLADPEFSKVPVKGLMHPDYIKERAKHLDTSGPVMPETGNPWPYDEDMSAQIIGSDATNDVAGTTHFVVVDRHGDVVSVTASVESIFGSGRMAGGMFLNNQLTDFSFRYEDEDGRPIANVVQPGKRPRSSMSPTIILDSDGDFRMATGSPGGSNIIAYTAKSILGVLDWGLTPQQAVELPNVVARGKVVRVEANTGSEELVRALERAGYIVDGSRGENSGLSVVIRNQDGMLIGGVDPRREGTIRKPE